MVPIVSQARNHFFSRIFSAGGSISFSYASVLPVEHKLIITGRAELALALKPLIASRAKENQKVGGARGGKGFQNSGNPLEPAKTDKELAKIAGVSHDTINKMEAISKSAPEKPDAMPARDD